jgi:hypothetical protein
MCGSFEFSKMKKILQKNSFFGHLENFEKSVFLEKIFETFLTQEITFFIPIKFAILKLLANIWPVSICMQCLLYEASNERKELLP